MDVDLENRFAELSQDDRDRIFGHGADLCDEYKALQDDSDSDDYRPMSAVCAPGHAENYAEGYFGGAELGYLCTAPEGYVIRISDPNIIDRIGHRWAKVFSKTHHSSHCALVIVESALTYDSGVTKVDLRGMRCYH